MGLCKCPKRKVTNQFCFEHRVNVCEHCMVQSHDKCVVQSYLAWLQDSDYSNECPFCDVPLQSDMECVRLVCYHLFHWSCLHKYFSELPANTAPAGYCCPTCSQPLFPPSNLVSPVADQLRRILKDVNWARPGLGLPLLAESLERHPELLPPSGPRPSPEGEDQGNQTQPEQGSATVQSDLAGPSGSGWKSVDSRSSGDTLLNLETPSATSRRQQGQESSSPTLSLLDSSLASSPLITGGDPDSEGNKYKRRTPTDWLARWWKSMMKPAAQRRKGLGGCCMGVILGLILLSTLVMVFSYLGRGGREDPLLDPFNNPNIRVGDIRL